MRKIRTLAAAAALPALTLASAASAQDIHIYMNNSAGPAYGTTYVRPRVRVAPPVRVYGYTQRAPVVTYVVPEPRPGCGEYRYWDGWRCLDARFFPPEFD